MTQAKRYCHECSRFIDPVTQQRCPNSGGPGQLAQKCDFQEGRPYRPLFHGRPVQDVPFKPERPTAWSFWFGPQQCLMLTWNVDQSDHNQYGHFDCYLMGLDNDGLITKEYVAGRREAAFYGEVAIKGAANNDLWASFGYEDDDQRDHEGSVLNKPRAVQLRPKRKD